MNYFNENPADLYRNLKEKIPSLKIKNQKFMNKIHNLNMSSDFWWIITGEFAILAEKAKIISSGDYTFLNDLKNTKIKFPKQKMISSVLINSIGKDYILNKNFTEYKKVQNKKDIEELLIEDEEKHFSDEIKISNKTKTYLPFKFLTNFLARLRLKKIKSIYLKFKKVIQINFFNSKTKEEEILNYYNSDEKFEKIFEMILPDEMTGYFPKWFLLVSKFLVKDKHKWTTLFGLELNVYQMILIARSFERFRTKNIKMVSHGLYLELSAWNIYRFSVFPNLKLQVLDKIHNLPKGTISDITKDILFCPAQLPFICGDFFSISHFWEFMKVYKEALKLIHEGIINKKKIKIRYKNLRHLTGYVGPQIPEENKIPIEQGRFEDVYKNYKLIVSMPFGTISSQCYQNDIDCISYHHPYYLTDKK